METVPKWLSESRLHFGWLSKEVSRCKITLYGIPSDARRRRSWWKYEESFGVKIGSYKVCLAWPIWLIDFIKTSETSWRANYRNSFHIKIGKKKIKTIQGFNELWYRRWSFSRLFLITQNSNSQHSCHGTNIKSSWVNRQATFNFLKLRIWKDKRNHWAGKSKKAKSERRDEQETGHYQKHSDWGL